MVKNLRELYTYRELLWAITCRDIRVRYKQSIMGFMWAVLMPILIIGSGVVVRYAYALAAHTSLNKADIASVAVKSLPWAFLVSSLRFANQSLINNKELVTKIYFPKEIFPIASVLASLMDLMVASAALIVFLAVMRVDGGYYLLWVPLLLLTTIAVTAGVGMIVAAASLYFRDVKFIVEVFLTFGIFFTPVFYDVKMLGPRGTWLYLNPAGPLLDGFGACVAWHHAPDLPWLAYSVVFALTALLGGYAFFKHLEPGFAESI